MCVHSITEFRLFFSTAEDSDVPEACALPVTSPPSDRLKSLIRRGAFSLSSAWGNQFGSSRAAVRLRHRPA